MGWKGTMRSVAATARRMEKEAERRHKQTLKEQATADAAEAVDSWERYVDDLLTVHTNVADRIDWQRLVEVPKPKEPVKLSQHRDEAQAKLSSFKPGIFAFFRGGADKIRGRMEKAVSEASAKDEADFQAASKKFAADTAEWEADSSLAKRLLKGEGSAIQEVITEMQTLSKTDLIGSAVEFEVRDNFVHARPQVHSDEVIPNYRRKQLASGKLSETKMPVSQFNELYQDYVASVALKVAGDLFQILPLDEVFVTCENEMLNTATGHQEPTPILSVQFVRATYTKLNLAHIDPSDSMQNFNHEMKFSRTKGFSPVKALGREEHGIKLATLDRTN